MTRENYMGMNQKDLISRYVYDPEKGIFYTRKTGKRVTSTNKGKLVLPVRCGDRILNLSPAKVALIIIDNIYVPVGHTISFKDGNHNNLKYSNISIIKRVENNLTINEISYHTKPISEGIVSLYYKQHDVEHFKFFVVRRGPRQSVYRTLDLEEAKAVYDEWLNDKFITRMDATRLFK